MALKPKAVTAAMIGLRSRLDSFKLQRFVNEYPEEAWPRSCRGWRCSSCGAWSAWPRRPWVRWLPWSW